MSNSIARARSRPRVQSSNFRSVWWAVRREAALQILYGDVSLSAQQRQRVFFCRYDGRWLARQVARRLLQFPGGRYTR